MNKEGFTEVLIHYFSAIVITVLNPVLNHINSRVIRLYEIKSQEQNT